MRPIALFETEDGIYGFCELPISEEDYRKGRFPDRVRRACFELPTALREEMPDRFEMPKSRTYILYRTNPLLYREVTR